METLISNLEGPVLVLGAGGFIGGNLFRQLGRRSDVYGTWRREQSFRSHRITCDLQSNARAVIELVKPATIFDCVAYGGYLNQDDVPRIYDTNVKLKVELLSWARTYGCTYIHAGSSSEYGAVLDAPPEDTLPRPNSHYAIAKHAAAGLVHFYGKHRGLRCCNLRLYAVYGAGEPEDNRLIPQLIKAAKAGSYPPLVDPNITRDFTHVDDVCEAFVAAAARLKSQYYGESFNIGTGTATSIRELAGAVRDVFGLKRDPEFATQPNREYDFIGRWCSDPRKALTVLNWRAKIGLREGLELAKGH
jgi:dolichol-phosphate mannosyltransferase